MDDNAELLMLKAWKLKTEGCYAEAFVLLDQVERHINNGSPDASSESLRGSVDCMRALQNNKAGRGQQARQHAEDALLRLPADDLSERAYSYLCLAMAMQQVGELEGVRKLIHEALADDSVPPGTFQGRLYAGLCIVKWIAADVRLMRSSARQYFELSEAIELGESMVASRYFLDK